MRKILDEKGLKECIKKLAQEIVSREKENIFCVVGIKRRGDIIAKRLKDALESLGKKIKYGSIDITLYRDDLTSIAKKPIVHKTEIPFNIEGEPIILVDDVLYTGRTIRAALKELVDLGRPKYVRLVCIIDRGHRELPICADYIGKKIETTNDEIVEVKVKELDGEDSVIVVNKSEMK